MSVEVELAGGLVVLQRGRACEGAEITLAEMGERVRMLLQRGRACEGAEILREELAEARAIGFNGAAPVRARK